MAAELMSLLGADQVDAAAIYGFLTDWESTFLEAAKFPEVDVRISAARLGYYKLACESMLANETPQTSLWPLMLTWTLSVSVLPEALEIPWRAACVSLGLDEGSFGERLKGLDHFLDGALEVLRGQDPEGRLAALQARFSKLPECYRKYVKQLAEEFGTERWA